MRRWDIEQRISIITLGVKDLKRSVEFYERLGWERGLKELTDIAFFQCPGVVFGLYPLEKLAEDVGVPFDPPSGTRSVTIAYNGRAREDVDQVLTQAVAAGGTLLKPAQEAFWGGYSGYFADPDGHYWEVAYNPGLEIAIDGSVRLPQ